MFSDVNFLGAIFIIVLIFLLIIGIISVIGKRKYQYGGYLTTMVGSTIDFYSKDKRRALQNLVEE